MTAGKSLELIRAGGPDDAPDLLFLHGFGADRFAWTATTPAFESDFRVWLVELPGHGANAEVDAITASQMAQVLAGALDGLSLPVSIVAHSLGATVAIELARQSPEHVKRAVLIAPLGLCAGVNEAFLRDFADLETSNATIDHLRMLVQRPRLISPQMATHVLGFLNAAGHRDTMRKIAQSALKLGAVSLPEALDATLIWGEEDAVVPPDRPHLESLTCPVSFLPGTGHMPQMEAIRRTNEIIARALEPVRG
ncbi:alpha/beta fold hydrolase [Tropicimonas marinistellae]|uniref:alpha/beta fold hydrolase n=1 Tax=Tropicimonas marinistellae TaxID=1739787 RepID=UPI000829E298|nr:alpha/beta fold hydrolase [Tropicimonas marinistellae]